MPDWMHVRVMAPRMLSSLVRSVLTSARGEKAASEHLWQTMSLARWDSDQDMSLDDRCAIITQCPPMCSRIVGHVTVTYASRERKWTVHKYEHGIRSIVLTWISHCPRTISTTLAPCNSRAWGCLLVSSSALYSDVEMVGSGVRARVHWSA